MASARRPIVAGNWKMNTTLAEGLALVDSLLPRLQTLESVDRVLCPPFVSLAAIAGRLRGTDVGVGAQNLHQAPEGAFTGEVSAQMLRDLVSYVIVGHSERRQMFGETDEVVRLKAGAAQSAGLTPIVCVGETLEQNERGETGAVVRSQTLASTGADLDPGRLVVAYEPIWAIGTGRAATAEGANQTIGLVRAALSEVFGSPMAATIRIQYGGSVTPKNIAELMAQPEIDGGLVGGASLKADQFLEIVRIAGETA